jgi:HAD superfamily hydrolase (TIGR01490 family)
MKLLSIFDVDRTITRKPTYSLFLLFAMRRLAPWRAVLLPLLIPVALAYSAGLISRRAMKEAMHRVALGKSIPRTRAREVAEVFAERLFRDGLYRQAIARIAEERDSGRTVMLATAAPALYIEPLARRLGITHAVATAATHRDDHLTHRIAGANCYGPEKLAMIAAALQEQGVEREAAHIRFFTDHASDRTVCEWADEAFAVNPSAKMASLARQKSWPILDWRRSKA